MKNARRMCALLMAMVCIVTCSVTAIASNVTPVKDSAAASTKIFEGYNVTVLDKTTPAANVRGRTNDRNVMCFVSAADQEVGVISHSDYNAIIRKNQKVVNLPGGGTYGAPPVEGKSWEEWFADEFNSYRGLASGSREDAVAANNTETIEKYRQEVIRLINAEREKAGLPAFESHQAIMDFAQVRAEELVDSYSHTRPDGSGAGTENAARGQMTPTEVVTAWMDSARHKANILKPANDPQNGIVSFTHIGVGCYRPSNSSGGYYWVLTFGMGPTHTHQDIKYTQLNAAKRLHNMEAFFFANLHI